MGHSDDDEASSAGGGDMGDLFQDPEGYYPPTPPPTKQTHTLRSGQVLALHVVGFSPTEAHHLWNGSRVVSDYFEDEPSRVRGKRVLELGAGAGLPSLTAGVLGASKVVMTDYPDVEIVQTMQKNLDECDESTPEEVLPVGDAADGGRKLRIEERVEVRGYIWGADVAPLLACLGDGGEVAEGAGQRRFDVLILADLLFRHSEHGKMIDTIEAALKRSRDSRAYVFFTSYRPWLRHKDLKFFDLVRERGFLVEQVIDRRMEKPLFEDDPGDVEILKTVSGFEVRWPDEKCED